MRRMFIAAIVLAAAFGFFFFGSKPGTSLDTEKAFAAPGATAAPDFTLFDRQGSPVSLSDFRGKVVMLNFWATWCPPCRAEMPSMERLHSKLQEEDFVLLAVNVEESGQSAVDAFVREIPVSFPVLFDSAQEVSRLYRVSGIPQTFIIDPQGRIVQQITGGLEWDSPEVTKYLSSLMRGERE